MKKYFASFLLSICAGLLFAQSPEIPTIELVSVNTQTGSVSVSWTFNKPETIDGVVIVRQIWDFPGTIDGSNQDIAEVLGTVRRTYVDVSTSYGTPNPNERQEVYRVKSYKLVDGKRVYSAQMSEPHGLVFLETPVFSPCEELVRLKWSPYQGWGGSLSTYIVYARAQGNDVYEQLATLGPEETSYVHKKPVLNIDYEYYISAINTSSGLRSNSNVKLINTHTPQPPVVFNANQASVNDDNVIDVQFSVDADATEIMEYVVEWTNNLDDINTIDLASFSPGEATINYTHYDARVDVVNYYRLKAIGICGKEIGHTNWAHNLVLSAQITDLSSSTNTIEWTPYSTWEGDVSRYDLYRVIDDSPPEFFASYLGTRTKTLDKVDVFKNQLYNGKYVNGTFCYYVVATENDKLLTQTIGKSVSARVCVHYPKSVQVPNAINPYSKNADNRIFLPKVAFVSEYFLKVYNRWGNIIFSTNAPNEGWEGVGRGGVIAPQGTYVYYLEFRDAEGEWTRLQGQINIVY